MTACRMSSLPASWIWLNAASLSSAQLPDGSVTLTVMLLLLSRLVTLSVVPIGKVPLEAAGAPPWPESVTVLPLQTTWPAPVPLEPTFPAFPPPPLLLEAAGGVVFCTGGGVVGCVGLVLVLLVVLRVVLLL